MFRKGLQAFSNIDSVFHSLVLIFVILFKIFTKVSQKQ